MRVISGRIEIRKLTSFKYWKDYFDMENFGNCSWFSNLHGKYIGWVVSNDFHSTSYQKIQSIGEKL